MTSLLSVFGGLTKRLSGSSSSVENGGESSKDTHFTLVQHVDYDSRRLRHSDARWEDEQQARVGFSGKLDDIVESAWLEALVSTCVLADLTLTIASFAMSEEEAESDTVFVLSAIFLSVLLLDVILRIAKDKLHFFFHPVKVLNWIEFIVGFGGAAMLVMDGVRRTCHGEGCASGKSNKGASLGRSIRPLLRVSRVLRAGFLVVSSRGGIHKKIDKATDKITDHLVRQTIGDMLILPDENITLKPSAGMFHLEKAQVRSEAFKGLHLPFTILGGVIDLFHVDLDLFATTAQRKRDIMSHTGHRLLIVIENVLLVVGPGHHQEPPAPQWNFEEVQERKSKLVELLLSRVQASAAAKPPGDAPFDEAKSHDTSPLGSRGKSLRTVGAASVRQTKDKAKDAVKKKLQLVIGEVLAHGMHVSIKHVEIRYEDADGCLSGGPSVIGGFKVCTGQIRAQGALEEEDLEDYHEEDFRVRGKWLLGSGPKAPSHSSEPTIPPAKVDCSSRDSTRSLFATGSYQSETPQTRKRHLNHGVRVAMEMHHIAVFWDLHQALPFDDNRLFAPKLQEGKRVDIKSFLQDCHRANCRERLRLAVCGQVEKAWLREHGKSALERLRRLRERVAAHRYLVMPAGCSVHAVVKPPSADLARPLKVAGQDHWPAATDIDVHIPSMPFAVDLNQAHSLVRLLDYVKRWTREDNRIMWQPPPHHEGSQVAFARWGYALRQVLHGIDDTYPWHSLSWMEMRRRAKINSEYLQELCSPPPLNTERISVLQVALPLGEVLLARQAALQVTRTRNLEKQRSGSLGRIRSSWRKKSTQVLEKCAVHMTKKLSSKEIAAESHDLMVRVHSAQEIMREEESVVKEMEKEAVNSIPASARATQVHVRVDLMEAKLLCRTTLSSAEPRRQLLRCEARGISVGAARCAPRRIWMHLAPPAALEHILCRDDTPEDFVVEVSVKDMRVVLCSAPSSAPRLRRMMSFTRIAEADPSPDMAAPMKDSMGSFLIRDETAANGKHGSRQGKTTDTLRDAGATTDVKRVSISNSMISLESAPANAAMTVLIKGASGLPQGSPGPYCTVKFKGQRLGRWRTDPARDNLSPVWSQSQRMQAPEPADVLEFAVFDGKDDNIGEAQLHNHLFYPGGFEGTLILKGTDVSAPGKLEIKIRVDGASEAEVLRPLMQVRATILKPPPNNAQAKAKVNAYSNAIKDDTRWIISIWIMPVEVYVMKPFLKQLATHFKAPEVLPPGRPFLRRVNSHLPPTHRPEMKEIFTSDDEAAYKFWYDLDKRRKNHQETTIKREKKLRKNEKVMGLMGPMAGRRMEVEVLFRGGMHATQIMEYSKATWLARTAILPPGLMKCHRFLELGGSMGMRTGYQPLAAAENGSTSLSPGPFRACNGWWYATLAEAQFASEVLSTGYLASNPKQDGDISCAGIDAYEEKEPLFSLPRTALSTWMPTYDRLNTNFSYRYKPHTSARGLIQLPHSASQRHDRSVCPVPLECCGCSSTEYSKPVDKISANSGEACEGHRQSRQVNGSQLGMVEVQSSGALTPAQEATREAMPLREARQDSAFGPGSQPSASLPSTALPSASGTNSFPSPKLQLGMDLASSISAEFKMLSDKEIGLLAPARLQEICEFMGVASVRVG